MIRSPIILALIICLAACGISEPPLPAGRYKVSAQEAYERLVSNDFADFRRYEACGVIIQIFSEGVRYRSVSWRVYSSGRDMLHFTAHLKPFDAAMTDVTIEVRKSSDGSEMYDGHFNTIRPVLQQPLRPEIERKIKAVLTNRPMESLPRQAPTDPTCNIQRSGMESGIKFTVNDSVGQYGKW